MANETTNLPDDIANVSKYRGKYCGGSDVATIMGISPFKDAYTLAKEKAGIILQEEISNSYIDFGNVMEPVIRDYINDRCGMGFVETTRVDEEKGIRSNTDGVDFTNDKLLEIKTTRNPQYKVYEAQMQLYMWHHDLKNAWLAVYTRPKDFNTDVFEPEERLQIRTVPRDDAYIERILGAIAEFWTKVEALKRNPDMTDLEFIDSDGTTLKPVIDKMRSMELQLDGFKKLQQAYKDEKNKLYDAMKEHDVKKFSTDEFTFSRVEPSTKKVFDEKEFRKHYPDMYEAYRVKPSKTNGHVRIQKKKKEE